MAGGSGDRGIEHGRCGLADLGPAGSRLGELAQRPLSAHPDTHLDPPAASIVATSVLIALAAAVGLLPTAAWIPVS